MKSHPRETVAFVPANNGHDEARLIREADPEGLSIIHCLVNTQRLIDRLYNNRLIDEIEHQIGNKLRDLYEMSGLAVGQAGCRSLETPMGLGSPPDLVSDEEAWREYIGAMNHAATYRPLLQWSVLNDNHPAHYPGGSLSLLQRGLDRIRRYWDIDVRREDD